MSNLITEELNLSKKRMFDEDIFESKSVVKLTRENVALAEAMIRNDSDYSKSFNKDLKPKSPIKYDKSGSSAYWMTQLKKILIDVEQCEYEYEKVIRGAVYAVDRENSTHLNADKCGREEIVERICNFDRNELVECLKNPNYKEFKLIKEIAKKTSAEKRARINISFASKFCHYACYYMFEGTEYQDNYMIYDTVLKNAIPLYLGYYKIKKKYNLNDYKEYCEAVDDIRSKTDEPISRNGFDHLVWYFHKGKDV